MAVVFLYEEHNSTSQFMKKLLCLAAGLLALNLTPVFGQSTPTSSQPMASPQLAPAPDGSYQTRLQAIIKQANQQQNEPPALTKFSLDFPGGTPKELVAAIEKAMGKPLNVIISDEDAATKLPPVKLSDMDVGKLFKTLSENAVKRSYYRGGEEIIRNYGFRTIDTIPSDNSLWTFYSYTKPAQLTQFSLDFPGGSPSQLVKAIEKAMGKRLNVIISKEDEAVELPPLKMENVVLPQLFTALEVASHKAVSFPNGPSSYQQFNTGYGFKSADEMTDTAVWYFHVEKPSLPPVVSTQKVCQYYSMAPYLDRGFTVDDITTAIQTGWKMAGVSPTPELSYHKETKMLIAYGEPDKLSTIGQVLGVLPQLKMSWEDKNNVLNGFRGLQQEIEKLNQQVARLTNTNTTLPAKSTSSPAEKSGN